MHGANLKKKTNLRIEYKYFSKFKKVRTVSKYIKKYEYMMNRFSRLNIVPSPCHLLNKNTWCFTAVLLGDMNYNGCKNVTGKNQ